MTELLVALTLLNIGMSSYNPNMYNDKVTKIEHIINIPLPCLAVPNMSMDNFSICNESNLKAILNHYRVEYNA